MKKLILSLTLLLSCVYSVFAKTGENVYYSIVLVSEDESMGTVSGSLTVRDDQPIVKNAYPKRGYKFTEWSSVNGLSTEIAEGNDTLIAHFEVLPSYEPFFLTSDSTKGVITESKVLYYENEQLGHDNVTCLPGWSFERWVDQKGRDAFNVDDVSENDTLTAYFTRYKETKYVNFFVNEYIYIYGNKVLKEFSDINDSIVVTNKRTGEARFYKTFIRTELEYGDTLVVSPITANGRKLDNLEEELTIKCDSVEYLNFVASVVTDTIELEDAVGDSFTVSVFLIERNETTQFKVAKGETLTLNEFLIEDHSSVIWDNREYLLIEGFSINVVNDVSLSFFMPETTAVRPTVADPVDLNAIVDVYDRSGRLLKRNVRHCEALDGLNKGIYIVGRKKVIKM